MSKNTGGPAFPCDRIPMLNGTAVSSDGMTLRDYFAAKAMQAMMPVWAKENAHWKTMAELAYDMAEEMLEAREK